MIKEYIAALTGSPDTVMDWRVINDRDKGAWAVNLRGSIDQVWQQLCDYNQKGWGIFVNVNAMDGQGSELTNVHFIRTHVVDLDDSLTSVANYQRAIASPLPPHFVVQTSPNKFHLYWLVEPYQGNDFYTTQQRKLNQVYDGDRKIVDATRVLRVPGFYHCKGEPMLVTYQPLHAGARYTAQQIADNFTHVNVVERLSSRSPLGTPDLAAPDLSVLVRALHMLDPAELSRDEWMSITAAFKQSGWTIASEQQLYQLWSEWCARYPKNDQAENAKLWTSIKDTEVGWHAFMRRTNIKPYTLFGEGAATQRSPVEHYNPAPPVQAERSVDYEYPEILDAEDCKRYFHNCFWVESIGEIFTPSGRFMNPTQFNGTYGGHQFIIARQGGKTTDEPWKACLRSTNWSIKKVDHTRFIPSLPSFEVVLDELKRKGVNIYLPIEVDARAGDVSRWLNHVDKILPNKNDQAILFAFMAHCIKFPGVKVRWAFLLQSAEGIGKSIFKLIMDHCLGSMRVHSPNANELTEGGSKFNSWVQHKLMIIIDEIKTDERRELVEILKPMITDERIEIQAKGQDQEMFDNPTNWMFFSNHKDAIPVSRNGRRYSVAYSCLQTTEQILNAGINDEYLNDMFTWLKKGGGLQAIAHWFLNYPVECGQLPSRAPHTSSHAEVIKISRTPVEALLDSKIESNASGFKNGFVSVTAFVKAILHQRLKPPAEHNIKAILESRGYHEIGYTSQPVTGEEVDRCSLIFHVDKMARPDDYFMAQT